MRRPSAQDLIAHFKMSPMETENVMFSQTYVSSVTHCDGRPEGTAIVALLTADADSFSDLHRLDADEVWHFYSGDPIELLLCHPDGRDELRLLGSNILEGHLVQTVVPAGSWMGARLRPGGVWGLYGNTMAPGFDLSGFEYADEAALMRRHARRATLISQLCRERVR